MSCKGVARPNILMFGDYGWISARTDRQEGRFEEFLDSARLKPMVVIEMGAGTAIPTIRHLSEHLGSRKGVTLVRINPREAQVAVPHLSLACGALEGVTAINGSM